MTELIFRHRCLGCDERFPVRVPEGEPVACPRCNTVAPAKAEPRDACWWRWFKERWYSQPGFGGVHARSTGSG
jgi:hypothetical protein